LLPNNISSPIAKNDITKIDPESFWYFPWGESGVHKGIDIFCEKGTYILSPVSGFVIKKGYGTIAGNYIYIIGPKWRTYYFAHMDTTFVSVCKYISKGNVIGKVGNTGNAAGKPMHLHYTIETVFPYFWLYDSEAVDGWKKMFYLNPMDHLGFSANTDSITMQ
jgi:peptidoglycan LD-endopeptidase LytH